jgi:hypothetical protein
MEASVRSLEALRIEWPSIRPPLGLSTLFDRKLLKMSGLPFSPVMPSGIRTVNRMCWFF